MEPMKPINIKPLFAACEAFAKACDVEHIAQLYGKNIKVVQNQLNPRQVTHKLGLVESAEYQYAANDYSILREYAATLEFAIVPTGDLGIVSDVELLNLYSDWNKELGDVHGEISRAFCDQRIERVEYERIKKEGMEAIQKYFEFLRRLEAVIDE